MKLRKLFAIVLGLAMTVPSLGPGQEKEGTNRQSKVEGALFGSVTRLSQERADPALELWGNTVPLLLYSRSSLASEDGHYLAQTREELQTYHDLGLSYQYIDSDAMRTQLQIGQDEGILITDVVSDKLGNECGFLAGDLVLKVQDKPVATQYEFVIQVTKNRGKKTKTVVRRDGKKQEFDFVISNVQVQAKKRWILGVGIDEMGELLKLHLKVKGVVINSLRAGGPAEKMGLKENDIITNLNEKPIESSDDLRKALAESGGKQVKVKLLRAGNRMTVELTPMQIDENSNSLASDLYLRTAVELMDKRLSRTNSRLQHVDSLLGVIERGDLGSDLVEENPNNELQKQLQEINQKIEDLSKQIQSIKKK